MTDIRIQDAHRIGALGTILGVWAHPDDEAFLAAGLMAMARDAGNRVMVITATRGELGTDDPVTFPPERLGRLRADEMAASLAAIGVTEHRWLGYVDGTCADVSAAEGTAQVRKIIEEIGPDTILTFGPDGITGHDDHRAVSRWTTAAWEETGRRGRLLYAATPEQWAVRYSPLNRRFNIYPAGYPVMVPDGDLALALELTGGVLERKVAALRAHASQLAPLLSAVGAEEFAEWWAVEAFKEAVVRPVGVIASAGR